jgi:hypothetical protein
MTDSATETEDDGDFKVIRAHELRSGDVVYLVSGDAGPSWSHEIDKATVYREDEVADGLQLAEKDAARNLVVGPEAIEITGKHEPVGAKETIRASGGPTIKYGEDALQPDYSI